MLLRNKIVILIAFVLVTIARNAVAQSVAPKIVDGTTAALGRYPYMVALRETKGRRYIFCAGTLISKCSHFLHQNKMFEVTGAHCSSVISNHFSLHSPQLRILF